MTYPSSPQQSDNPAYVNQSTRDQEASLCVVRDLCGGTPAMRAAGVKYLPKEAGESQDAYKVRLERSLLFNTYWKTLTGLVGIALKKNIELESDVPQQLKTHIEDIDLAGSHLDVFAKELFRKQINDGHVFILVDMAPPLKSSIATLSPVPTALDDRVSGRRPHWVQYTKDQARNWKSDRINGETILTQITFKECATEDAGLYAEKEVVRYRTLRLQVIVPKTDTSDAIYGPMEWELSEEVEKGKDPVWIKGDVTNLARIPVVPIYSRKTGFLQSIPALIDLAYLNIGHWQQSSDLTSQIRMLVPVMEIKGDLAGQSSDGEGAHVPKQTWGPGTAIQFTGNPDFLAACGIEYKSANPDATAGLSTALENLEKRMSAVGLSLINPKPSGPAQATTATEKVLDQDERTSELAIWHRNLKDGIELAMKIHAVDYLGLDTGGSIITGFDEVDESAVTAIEAPKGMPPGNTAMPPASTMVQ